MTTIKALEGSTVHQIQSGQVIVDLCSVVKELVENSLDAGATAIDVRFRGNGLESIEVQDNGAGISSENYGSIALKHHTSKLASYHDLGSLQTFGFRGEALSSLCALSNFHIVTVRAEDAPKGSRLDFETSGKLKGTQVVASQKGTTVVVENIFANLPVRRRELEKNIKREYGKALAVLQAYACISTRVKLSVSNMMAKGKKATVFATKSNNTTRETIANVFGAKVLPGLVNLDLRLEMQQTSRFSLQGWVIQPDPEERRVQIVGHVSRPVFGDGRQLPDRQMFFVNARPCGLPQVARVFNEVYRGFNVSQSPFVFANIVLDTNAYDVNVSPDKRTILLHDQDTLLENLRISLTELFERQDQTIPQTQPSLQRLPSYKNPMTSREASAIILTASSNNTVEVVRENRTDATTDYNIRVDSDTDDDNLIEGFAARDTMARVHKPIRDDSKTPSSRIMLSEDKQKLQRKLSEEAKHKALADQYDKQQNFVGPTFSTEEQLVPVSHFNKGVTEEQAFTMDEKTGPPASLSDDALEQCIPRVTTPSVKSQLGVAQNTFDRMRPRHQALEVAEVTVGDTTTTVALGPTMSKRQKIIKSPLPSHADRPPAVQRFSSSMRSFAASGTQLDKSEDGDDDDDDDDDDGLNQSSSVERNDEDDTRSPSSVLSGADDVRMGLKHNTQPEVSRSDDDGESNRTGCVGGYEGSDDDYLDEQTETAKGNARVAALIQKAEEAAAVPSQENIRRANNILKGRDQKDSTMNLIQIIKQSIDRIEVQVQALEASITSSPNMISQPIQCVYSEASSPEERLSLTVSKDDFSRMSIVGQFNLGFILAVRPSHSSNSTDELFIIDQHASDEKFNFERLQSTTIVQEQRLVHPYRLDLTAIEEEIIIENSSALLKNGFLLDVDTSGKVPVGKRCKLVSLPMSREVTFDTSDLEELIVLLAESTPSAHAAVEGIPRPSKVRKMFAMRACRSSIMIGKSLSLKQMVKLVRKMGEIDKPWNCPHGRPTMRHLLGLAGWRGWEENGIGGSVGGQGNRRIDWGGWMKTMREMGDEDIQGTVNCEPEAKTEGNYDQSSEEIGEKDEEGEHDEGESSGKGLGGALFGRFAYD